MQKTEYACNKNKTIIWNKLITKYKILYYEILFKINILLLLRKEKHWEFPDKKFIVYFNLFYLNSYFIHCNLFF